MTRQRCASYTNRVLRSSRSVAMRAHRILAGILVAVLVVLTLHACGGDSSQGGGAPASASVTSYVTDDLGGYDSVVLTVNKVEIRHTSGRSCAIITGPLT